MKTLMDERMGTAVTGIVASLVYVNLFIFYVMRIKNYYVEQFLTFLYPLTFVVLIIGLLISNVYYQEIYQQLSRNSHNAIFTVSLKN